jgi:outer membrane protein OmpA-like peptidoglycan-associated protein
MISKKLIFILAGALLLTEHVAAKTINVPGEFKKIGDALGNADAGDTIFVKRGVYDENITLVMGVVVKGEDPITTIIDGGRRGPTVMGTSGAEISHVTIRNGIEGVLCENAAPSIHHTWILDNHATGLGAFISLPDVRNNVIYGNRWSGILTWGAKSLDTKIEQNVVMRNGYSGLTLMGPSNIVARNNIFMENHYYGIFADPAAGQTKVEFNNIFKNYYPFNRFIKVNRTNISLDPKFINPSLSKPNFFVSSRSPMIKRGKGKLDIGLLEKEEKASVDGDSDGDGLADSEDACPDVAEDFDSFEDEDGCADLDNDADGVADAEDKCPADREDKDGFQDGDGCPDFDNDNDGLKDDLDKCPDKSETMNGFKDDDGCPDVVPVDPPKTFLLEGVEFESGSAKVKEESLVMLNNVADQLVAFPDSKFKIIGHTDDQGAKVKNQELSKQRADAVKDYLVSKGVASDRLSTEGKGQIVPIASNKTPEGRAKNRRIEFIRQN